MKIETSFDVPAPPDVAWRLLNDVPRVLPCMPGAELDEQLDENTFKVTMHVKVGAVALRLKSDVRRTEVDEDARRVVLVADARDEKGRGGAAATITSSLEELGEGSRATIETDVQLRGPLASIGRGVVGAVAGELTKAFATRLAAELAVEASPGAVVQPRPLEPVAAIGGLRLLFRSLFARLRPRR